MGGAFDEGVFGVTPVGALGVVVVVAGGFLAVVVVVVVDVSPEPALGAVVVVGAGVVLGAVVVGAWVAVVGAWAAIVGAWAAVVRAWAAVVGAWTAAGAGAVVGADALCAAVSDESSPPQPANTRASTTPVVAVSLRGTARTIAPAPATA